MDIVNWESNITSWGDGLSNAHSESLVVNAVIAELATGRSISGDYCSQVLLHDSEVSDDQEEGVKRVLDDSPSLSFKPLQKIIKGSPRNKKMALR